MKVAVIVPRGEVVGGVARAALAVCAHLRAGAAHLGDEIDVVLAVGGHQERWTREAERMLGPTVAVRSIRFERVDEETAEMVLAAGGRQVPDDAGPGPWAMVRDGAGDLDDCDVWLQVTTRVAVDDSILPLLPVRPVVLVPFDFLEAYGYTGMPPEAVEQSLRAARAAQSVLVSTMQAYGDAVAFAGCRVSQLVTTPVEFAVPAGPGPDRHPDGVAEDPFCLWVSNSSPHKNHERTLDALASVARRHPDFRCVVTGYGVERRIDELAGGASGRPAYLDVRGFVTDSELAELMSKARFLLHSAVLDNGSYTPLEAAAAGCPVVSADYPPMREIATTFGLRCLWFDPWDVDEIARAVEEAWADASEFAGQEAAVAAATEQSVSEAWYRAVRPRLVGHVRV